MADVTESDDPDVDYDEPDDAFEDDLLEPDGEFDEDYVESTLEDDDLAAEDLTDADLADPDLADDDLDEGDLGDAAAEEDEPPLAGEDDLTLDPTVADDGPDEVEAIRDGEFVCSSCHMAKRESALADPEQMLCRDCA